MPDTDARQVALKCLESWTSGDFDTTRSLLADEVTFVGPLGRTEGVEAYMDGIKRLSQIVERAKDVKVVSEGGDVCVRYDLITIHPSATIPTVGWYHTNGETIQSVQAFFDPRPLLEQ